jgi:hypothetical protein
LVSKVSKISYPPPNIIPTLIEAQHILLLSEGDNIGQGKNQGLKNHKIEAIVFQRVQSFLDKLRLKGFQISKAYIFGSYAKGQVDRWSDIDVAVISPQIGNDRFVRQIKAEGVAVH